MIGSVPLATVLQYVPEVAIVTKLLPVSKGWSCAAIVATISAGAAEFSLIDQLAREGSFGTIGITSINLGAMCAMQGDYESAIEYYSRAIELRGAEMKDKDNVAQHDFDWKATWEGLLNGIRVSFRLGLKLTQSSTDEAHARCKAMAANAIVGVAVHHSKDGVGPLVLSQLI